MFLSPAISKITINKMHAKLNERQELSNCFSVRILNWYKGPIEPSKTQTWYWVFMANFTGNDNQIKSTYTLFARKTKQQQTQLSG